MAQLHQLLAELLADRRITDKEVDVIRNYIVQDGQLDMEDVKFLVEAMSNADSVCPAFDELFFPVLRDVILEDGKIGQDEQFYLLKMLYSDGCVRESEKRFLQQLRRDAQEYPPEFETLCATAFNCESLDWDVGGSPGYATTKRR